jgi:DNA polymerase III epsilon subunit-like protein
MIYLVADTETTDASDARGTVEIAWIELDENWNIQEMVESLIDPQKPISPSASGVHGLTYEDVQDSPTLEEFFTVVRGRRIQGPVTLIGHRISFDRPAFEPFVDGEVFELDTLRFVRWLYPDMDDHKLSTCLYALNLPRDSGAAHRALADVLTAMHLAKHIAERLNMTLPELAARAQEPIPVASLPFGKHKGDLLEKVPRSYLSWALNNMTLDNDYVHAIKSILKK